MANIYVWLVGISLAIVFSTVNGICKTDDESKKQCTSYYNQSLPSASNPGVKDERVDQALNQRDKSHVERTVRLSQTASLRAKRETNDVFAMRACPTLTEIERKQERIGFSLTNFEQPLENTQSIHINTLNDCLQESVIDVSSLSQLKVLVPSCCVSDCVHEITLRAKEGHNILLDFTDFKVPDLQLLIDDVSKTCQEHHLDIGTATRDDGFYSLGRYCGARKPGFQFVQNNEVKLRLYLVDNIFCVDDIAFTISVSPCLAYQNNDCSDMRLVQLNENEGYVTSPGFDMNLYYPHNRNCSVQISVPEDKLIKFTLSVLQLGSGDSLTVTPDYNASMRPFRESMTYTGSFNSWPPLVLPSNESSVQFTSDDVGSNVGFNLTYVAVEENEFIPMLSNGSLDCSGIDVIPEYIKCDVQKSCARGEDESSKYCALDRAICGSRGYRHERNICFYVIKHWQNISWIDAAEICKERYGGRLVSINTDTELEIIEQLWEQHSLNAVFLGLRRMKRDEVPDMYKHLWRWSNGQTGLYLPNELHHESWAECSLYAGTYFYSVPCLELRSNVSLICEYYSGWPSNIPAPIKRDQSLDYQRPLPGFTFLCLSGEFISLDLRCDGVRDCYDGSDETLCQTEDAEIQKFECQSGQLVRFSYVCNGRYDCIDQSDEANCVLPDELSLPPGRRACNSGSLINSDQWCDGQRNCHDGSDEDGCLTCSVNATLCPQFYCFPTSYTNDSEIDCPVRNLRDSLMFENMHEEKVHYNVKPPGIVYPDGYGKVTIEPMSESQECPDTHFQCYRGFCIPIYMLCNDYIDCPYGEDEDVEVCESQCQGLYKCKHSSICVHESHICDSIYHCPFKDDEDICASNVGNCPTGCTCMQSEITCDVHPIFDTTVDYRYIHIKNIEMYDLRFMFSQIHTFSLIYLNVSRVHLTNIYLRGMFFPNLLIFDASHNVIDRIHHNTFAQSPRLEQLYLAGNNLDQRWHFKFLQKIHMLRILDLSHNPKAGLYDDSLTHLKRLQRLYIQNIGITTVNRNTFRGLVSLEVLDLRGNRIATFTDDVFLDQQNLASLKSDNFRLCCDSIAPEALRKGECVAPLDEVSSCTDLLRSYFLRVSLWVIAALTVVGNVGVIIWRIFVDGSQRKNFRIIVTNLAGSDLMMGIYLIIIGIADLTTRNNYLLYEEDWKASVACQVGGYLSLLSTEVSALFILLATVDRLLVIVFPLRREFHLTSKSATAMSLVVWLIGLILATIPLLPPFDQWELYSQRPMGAPLPITIKDYPGLGFAFGVFIILNMFIFILICAGQLIIYLSVTRRHRPQVSESRMKQDTTLAKRLILVVATDCLCWFPITTMGLMARAGVQIPVDVHVMATVLILPANSALNPFLYTINAIFLKWKKVKSKSTHASSDASNRTNLTMIQK